MYRRSIRRCGCGSTGTPRTVRPRSRRRPRPLPGQAPVETRCSRSDAPPQEDVAVLVRERTPGEIGAGGRQVGQPLPLVRRRIVAPVIHHVAGPLQRVIHPARSAQNVQLNPPAVTSTDPSTASGPSWNPRGRSGPRLHWIRSAYGAPAAPPCPLLPVCPEIPDCPELPPSPPTPPAPALLDPAAPASPPPAAPASPAAPPSPAPPAVPVPPAPATLPPAPAPSPAAPLRPPLPAVVPELPASPEPPEEPQPITRSKSRSRGRMTAQASAKSPARGTPGGYLLRRRPLRRAAASDASAAPRPPRPAGAPTVAHPQDEASLGRGSG